MLRSIHQQGVVALVWIFLCMGAITARSAADTAGTTAPPAARLPDVARGTPLHSVEGDPTLLSFPPESSKEPSFRGRLAYVVGILSGKYIGEYIGVRSVGQEPSLDHSASDVYYPLNEPYQPQFSPDGKYVLFKRGSPYFTYPSYFFYVWDLNTNEIKQVSSKFIYFPHVIWSPDGQYLAYLGTGDEGGRPIHYIGNTIQLYTLNWRTGQERLILDTADISFRWSFAWGPPHTLYYTQMRPAPEPKQPVPSTVPHRPQAVRSSSFLPAIYKASPETGKSSLFLRSAYRPVPSPDGQWIAFFGPEHPDAPYPLAWDWEENPRGFALSVVRTDGTERRAINSEDGTYPALVWMPDSKHLIAVKTNLQHTSASITAWDILKGTRRVVGSLSASLGYKGMHGTWPIFVKNASNDGQWLFVEVIDRNDQRPEAQNNHPRFVELLKAVNLKSGDSTTIVTDTENMGFDWFDESVPGSPTTGVAKGGSKVP